MFNDVVLLHGDQTVAQSTSNVCSSEKMTQTGEGNLWSESDAQTTNSQQVHNNIIGKSSIDFLFVD